MKEGWLQIIINYEIATPSKTPVLHMQKQSEKVVGGIASKEPKTGLPCPRPICKDVQKELVELKEKSSALEQNTENCLMS